jgi:hypothetical protein
LIIKKLANAAVDIVDLLVATTFKKKTLSEKELFLPASGNREHPELNENILVL